MSFETVVIDERGTSAFVDRVTALPLDLARGPLFRAVLGETEEGDSVLVLSAHIAVCDEPSMSVVVEDFEAAFAGRAHAAQTLGALDYADFAAWQRSWAEGKDAEEHVARWKTALDGAPAALDIPADRPRPRTPSRRGRGGLVALTLDASVCAGVRALANRAEASIVDVITAAFASLLTRLSGTDEVVFGRPHVVRRPEGLSRIVGPSVNVLPLRVSVEAEPPWIELVTRVKNTASAALSHADVPFEVLVDRLEPTRDSTRTPFFQCVVSGATSARRSIRLGDARAELLPCARRTSAFDLTLTVREDAGHIGVELLYAQDLFDPTRGEEMLAQLCLLLEQGAKEPEAPISTASLVTKRALAVLPDPEAKLDTSYLGAVQEVFAKVASGSPDLLAIADPKYRFTYGELEVRANQLAHYLVDLGCKKGDRVAIFAHRSASLVLAILGVLKAGGAFVLLDPSYPVDRLAVMLEVAKPSVFLRLADGSPVPEDLEDALDALRLLARFDVSSEEMALTRDLPKTAPRVSVDADDIAYVLFTSGSTGRPKGVLGRHGPLTHFNPWMAERFALTNEDRFAMLSGLAHAPLQRDLLMPIQIGASIHAPDSEILLEPAKLAAWMNDRRVTFAHMTPPFIQVLTLVADKIELPHLRRVFIVGDTLSPRDVDALCRLAPNVTAVNYLGATEIQRATSFHVTAENGVRDPRDAGPVIPVGRGIPDVQLLVVTKGGKLAGIGELGEIVVRSPHLAAGYLDDADGTRARFVEGFIGHGRAYRTGDLGRFKPSGGVDYVGRRDMQVKIRGFRVELGEIEATLLTVPGVKQAVVIAREDRPGDKRLVAYVVGEDVDMARLKATVASKLPNYMVPSAFVQLDAIPLTPNRKVDRRALPPPPVTEAKTEYAPPRNEIEEKVARAFQDVLGIPRDVGIHEDFFDLGGHSLSATQLVARLRDMRAELPLGALFEASTVAAIAERLRMNVDAPASTKKIERVDRSRPIPASFGQARFWFLATFEPDAATYNLPLTMRIRGELDVAVLSMSLEALVARHEVFRTTFASDGDFPVQIIHPTMPTPLERSTAEGPTLHDRETNAATLVEAFIRRPFDLANGPVLRAMLVRVGDGDHILSIVRHHIASDGWSRGILLRELEALYAAFKDGRPSPLAPLAIDYADFSVWQRRALEGRALDDEVAFWRAHLAGAPDALDLPTDHPRPQTKLSAGGRVPVTLTMSVSKDIDALARACRATPFMVFLSAYSAVLARWSRQDHVVVGTPVAGRTHQDLEKIHGLFINSLPLHTSLEGRPSFRALVERSKQAALDAFRHQDLPFERLIEALNPPRDLSRTPIYQALFVFQSFDGRVFDDVALRLPDVDVSPMEPPLHVAQFDLTLELFPTPDGYRGFIDYDAALFDRATVVRFADQFGRLLEGALRRPDAPIDQISILSLEERSRLLGDWSGATASLEAHAARPPAIPPLPVAVAEQARKSPERLAVVCGDERLTYAELEALAAGFRQRLRQEGVRPDDRVGLCMGRSARMVAALLGIQGAGAAYVPVDPEAPVARAESILQDASCKVVIADEARAVIANGRVVINPRSQEPASGSVSLTPSSLAYVLFTSGSTGTPKGILVSHESVSALSRALESVLPEGSALRVTVNAPLHFDASVKMLIQLARGHTLHVVSEEHRYDPAALARWADESKIDILDVTPGLVEPLLEAASELGRTLPETILVGGEAISPALWHKLARYVRNAINVYGPTEYTVDATASKIRPGKPNIGRPLPGVRSYVLDAAGGLLPIGIPGELHLAGPQVALGYFGRAALTAQSFVPDPFVDRPGERMYRTGDLVRWRADGTLEYLGRIDHQVKIRGYRIEVGEIESVLAGANGVEQAVVLAREDERTAKRLVAYVVPKAGVDVRAEQLKAEMALRLPEYMVPSAFVVLEALPLTSNGKVDKKALPAPDAAATEAYVAPRDHVEEALAGIFRKVLGLERVGVHDDFFVLGGHSLLATKLASRVRATLSVELPIRTVFEAPTVAALAPRVRASSEASLVSALTRADRSGPVPASYAQSRLWFLDQLEPGSAAYNVPFVLRVAGPLDADALERAVRELVVRHEVLRTTFVAIDGEPHQLIHAAFDVALRRVSASSEEEGRELVTREVHTPFDLANGPVVRATLVKVGEALHVFVLNIHHIATDGWSAGILTRELSALYEAFAQGKPSPLSAPAFGYVDFAGWQRAQLTPEVLEGQLGFWREHLRGAPAALELPLDRPRPLVKQYKGARIRVPVPAELSGEVKALCAREGVTPFMLLLAAYQCVLSRWSGQKDVVVGAPTANRTSQELEGIVGFFVNTLALRTSFDGIPTFRELLRRVRTGALEAYAHQDVPFEKLVDALGVVRDTSRTPVFQAMFAMENVEADAVLRLGEAVVSNASGAFEVSKFDLTLTMVDAPSGTCASLEYDVALFDRATIERFASHFLVLLEAATRCPDAQVATLPLMTEAERQRVLVEWNRTARNLERGSVVEWFELRVKSSPDALAVVTDGESLTYGELNARANRLGRLLRKRGVSRGDRVATWFTRTADMIVAELAVMKAGAAYVPVDPTHPVDRVAYVVSDVGAKVVLSTREVSTAGISALDVALLNLDSPDVRNELASESELDIGLPLIGADAAYVIYTSGTTGHPKGSVIEHSNLANLVAEHLRLADIASKDRVTQIYGPAFDGAIDEIWPTLSAGASLYIVSDELRMSPDELIAWIARHQVTIVAMPTALATTVLDADWTRTRVRFFSVGGEALRRRPRPGSPFAFINTYGPTETTDYVTCEEVEPGDHPVSTIGRPIQNTAVYVLDTSGEPAPIGVRGELYVGGLNVGRGYFAKPELTAERFVPDPFSAKPGARMYRTGDRARWLEDSRIEYLGRTDDQVKIRGFRIEPAEIEVALRALPSVQDAVVLARSEGGGEKRLVAYLVPRDGQSLASDALSTHLRKTLAEHMVPSAFVFLDVLPLTANGKVDKKALPAPDFTASIDAYVAPRSELEVTLAAIFREVLALERVGVHDDFFALGGHSLLAVRVVARVQRELGVTLPVGVLFTSPTLRSLAEEIALRGGADGKASTSIARIPREGPLALSFPQERIWFLAQLDPESTAYNIAFARRLVGELNRDALAGALRELVRRHEVLRTVFVDIDGEPAQLVQSTPDRVLEIVEVSTASDADVKRYVDEYACARLDLSKSPMSARLVGLGPRDHLLLMNIHHIACDGWSMGLLERELSALYDALASDLPSPLAPLPVQFVDYAAWQRAEMSSERARTHIEYWSRHLAGAPPTLDLPTDRPHRSAQHRPGAEESVQLSAEQTRALTAIGQRSGASLFMTLLAGFSAVLSRLAGQEDVVIGVPVAERSRAEVEGVIGFFLNTIPLRLSTSENPSFQRLVEQARDVSLAGYAHQDVPFEKVVDVLQVERGLMRTPIFQVMLVARTFDQSPSLGIRGLSVAKIRPSSFSSKYDLTLYYDEDDAGLNLSLAYDSGLFDSPRMKELASQLRAFLAQAIERPDAPVKSLSLVTEAARAMLPDPTVPIEAEAHAPVQRTVFEWAERAGAAGTAVEWREVRWTHSELQARARAIAGALVAHGVAQGERVIVTGTRCPAIVAAMLGAWAAAVVIVPVSDDLPDERLRVIVQEAGAVLALVVGGSRANWAIPTLRIDAMTGRVEGDAHDVAPLEREALERDPAYVFFTSGTTGKPKGVLGWHRGLAHFLKWQREHFDIGRCDRAAQMTGLGFDVVMRDVFTPLTAGATLCIPPEPLEAMDAKAAFAWLTESAITVMHSVPSVMEAYLTQWTEEAPYERLRVVFMAGEPLTDVLVARIRARFPMARIVNLYGPTETTLAKCFYEVPQEPRVGIQPIGWPLPHAQVLVVNDGGTLCGIHEPGEIVIRTPYRSLGYLNEASHASSRFQSNPFGRVSADDIVYRTGDRGRYRLNGQLEILGRVDDQVKIRGVRVEPAEVAAVLRQNDGVTACFVAAFRGAQNQNALAAYVVLGGTPKPEATELRSFLAQRLPPAMVPSAFLVLDALPLTANGKVDRKALPVPSAPAVNAARAMAYVAPRNSLEEAIARIWQDVLKVDRVGIHDDYFALGGHSLTVTRMIARIRKEMAFELQVRDVFERPTVAMIAEVISGAGETETF